jgi:hypothetical protein
MQVNVNSSYENYNKITLKGLLISGPQKTLLQIPKSFIDLIYFAWDVIKHKANLGLIIVLVIPFYLFGKKIEWQMISGRYYLLGLFASTVLIFSAIYPYAVVNKVNDNLYEYTSRFDMLLVVGFSILITLSILYFFKNENIGKLVLSFVFSILFVCKLSVFINFYYQSKLQTSFYDSYLSKLDSNQSYLIHEKNNHIINWRFYEIGGILRAHKAPENVFFIFGKSKFFSNDTINKVLVQKNVDINHFALRNFKVNDFQYKPVEFMYKEKLDVLDFFKLLFGAEPIAFKVKELKS